MKRLLQTAIIDIRREFKDWREFEGELDNGTTFEPFEEYYVPVDFKNYLVAIEGWYPDCLESVNLGETTLENVEEHYLSLMEEQFGFKAERHNYLPNSRLSEYGVSYIAREINI